MAIRFTKIWNELKFWVILALYGSLWVILVHYGSFWLIPCFSTTVWWLYYEGYNYSLLLLSF